MTDPFTRNSIAPGAYSIVMVHVPPRTAAVPHSQTPTAYGVLDGCMEHDPDATIAPATGGTD